MFKKIIITGSLFLLSLNAYAADHFKINSYMSTIRSNNSLSIEMNIKLHGANNELVLLYFYPEGTDLPENSSDITALGNQRYFIHEYMNKYEYSLDLLKHAPTVYFLYTIDKQAILQSNDGIPVGKNITKTYLPNSQLNASR